MSLEIELQFIDDALQPIVENASRCIPLEQLDNAQVAEDDREPWKAIMLMVISGTFLLRMVALIHQRCILNDKKGSEDRFNRLSAKIRDIFDWSHMQDARAY